MFKMDTYQFKRTISGERLERVKKNRLPTDCLPSNVSPECSRSSHPGMQLNRSRHGECDVHTGTDMILEYVRS